MMLPNDQTLYEVELEEYASYTCNTFPSPLTQFSVSILSVQLYRNVVNAI